MPQARSELPHLAASHLKSHLAGLQALVPKCLPSFRFTKIFKTKPSRSSQCVNARERVSSVEASAALCSGPQALLGGRPALSSSD